MMALCIVLIGPYDHLLNFTALRLSLFYAAAFSSFVALLYFALYVSHRFNLRAYSLFTVGFAGLGASLSGLIAALILGAPMPSAKDMALVTGFNLVFCYLGEIIQSTFIIPRILADLRGRPPRDFLTEFLVSESGSLGVVEQETSESNSVDLATPLMIFGQSFLAEQILLIEAEEHYVSLTLENGTRRLLRGRIADAVAVMPPNLGRQVHRSYWVAAAAVLEWRPEKSGAKLVLTNGMAVPVARHRLSDVRTWAEAARNGAKTQKAP